MSQKKKIVLVGNGMAGINTIEHMLKLAPNKFDMTVFGSEPYPNYNRIMLSSVLAGDSTVDDIVMNPYEWYEKHGITLYTGQTVTNIDTTKQTVTSDQGVQVPYDELILATGSNPFMLPLPGADKEGVIAFRNIQDCQTMIDASKKYKKAVVIGGGLLGLEAARGFINLGMQVDVVHICDHLMERQLDPTASKMLQEALEEQGMNFLLNKESAEILGEERVTGLSFRDGTSTEADLVVMAVGIRPNVELAQTSGIEVDRGIVVNDVLETNQPHVFAVGECAQHRETVYGLVAPLYEQSAVLAKRLADVETEPYEGSVVDTKLKVSGVDVFSGGEFIDTDETKAIRVHDEFSGIYKKVLIKDNQVVGTVLFGDTKEGSRIMKLVRDQVEVSQQDMNALLTGSQGNNSTAPTGLGTEHMDNADIICGCNGVSKGDICQAIQEQGLSTVEEVKNVTKASRSCGGCRPLVSEILEHTLGDQYTGSEGKEPICACTDYSHEEVVEAIREKQLTYVKEVMNVLEWKNEEGCSKCRPALNYYLGVVDPVAYSDDHTSRFVNERMHANIQKDGTYSVVPRIYGGVTTPEDLKKIAEVALKYEIPTVKLTGGQRIDLLGVQKENLTEVWEDLGMRSGHAYGKALRTVKTCVGDTYCRFGTADAMGMGIRMEKRFEGLNTPHKVKMSVSGCPRNCAESGIKDLGVVAIDGGWELYVGGNGGVKIRVGDLLATVKTEDELIEYAEAFLQYYRETARYLERTAQWVERMGLEHVQAVIEDDEQRQALCQRMVTALSVHSDPWQKAIEDKQVQKDLYEVIDAKA
ncbi:nitrite reductase large subunit NirB [Caldalkalibacillus salinus]|uniref:nitrite reductase large subunit NirB n=1 Tax=Caldalkalibacillus salinus TaxID=2803787 RepID=UPI0019242262|nr:nitrite reductase large subunit NirB [Caldalkalibacillus salinus]